MLECKIIDGHNGGSITNFPLHVAWNEPQVDTTEHLHSYTELVLILKGNSVHYCGETSVPVMQGDVLVVPPGIVHFYRNSSEDFSLVNIIFLSDLKLCLNINYFMSFMWAGVATCVVLIVFNAIWGRMRYLFFILTALLWLTIASIHIQILLPTEINIWPVYFLGIPLQILIILWGALIKKPKGFYKKEKNLDIEQ